MTLAMEFHDSTLLEMKFELDGSGYMLFKSSVYRSPEMAVDHDYESGWQNVRLSFVSAVGSLDLPIGEYASDGSLSINDVCVEPAFTLAATWGGGGLMPLPFEGSGSVKLELCLSPLFQDFTIVATHIDALAEGPFELEARWDSQGNVKKV